MINLLIKRYGWLVYVRILFYPITSLVMNPIRLIQSLWKSRVLADGKWGEYPHFSPHSAINSLFYWTAAFNFYTYGRSGISPTLGLGNYSLSRWFHHTLFSLYMYWKGGAVALLFGMFTWWISHLVWLDQIPILWVFVVMVLSLISTTFYSNLFALQNYNVLGWALVPLALYFVYTTESVLATLVLLAISFFSFTIIYIFTLMLILLTIISQDISMLLLIIPAVLKLSTHFWPFLKNGEIKTAIINVLKLIGFLRKTVKKEYKRKLNFGEKSIYFLVVYIQFVIVYYYAQSELPVLMVFGIFLYLLNHYFRFADDQSLYMFVFSIGTFLTLISPFQYEILISYWILVSPLAVYIGFPSDKTVVEIVPCYEPFSIKKLLEDTSNFLGEVKPGNKVIMAFNRPSSYGWVFDTYRTPLEVLLYIASKKKFHLFPDWYTVAETNFEGAPDFWGRDYNSVIENAEKWDVDYIVIYEGDNGVDEAFFNSELFELRTTFDWSNHLSDLNGVIPFRMRKEPPKWYLLKVK